MLFYYKIIQFILYYFYIYIYIVIVIKNYLMFFSLQIVDKVEQKH